jgi:hypothetical protein
MNYDLRTLATLILRAMALYFLIWGFLEVAVIVTNYVMVWTNVFFRDEVAVRPRVIEMGIRVRSISDALL